MLQSQIGQRHLLKTDRTDELADLVELDGRLAEQIDALDAETAAIREKITSTCGIPHSEFESYFLLKDSLGSDDIRQVKGAIRAMLEKISAENGALQAELEEALRETGGDIEDLRRIIGLKSRIVDGGRKD